MGVPIYWKNLILTTLFEYEISQPSLGKSEMNPALAVRFFSEFFKTPIDFEIGSFFMGVTSRPRVDNVLEFAGTPVKVLLLVDGCPYL